MANTPFEHALVEEIIPFIDASFRTLADQPHRALAGLSMGGMYTHGISLAHLDKFAYIGMFSGGSIGVSEIRHCGLQKEGQDCLRELREAARMALRLRRTPRISTRPASRPSIMNLL
jgi:enterochelin esterase-like enzyme